MGRARAARGPRLALPRTADIAIDPQALGFAGLLAVTTAALFAFAPAWHLSRVDLMHIATCRGLDGGSRRATRLRSTLVAIEVGLLVVLLACATLMQRTLTYLAGVDPGFRADGLMAVRLVQPGQQDDGDTAARFAARLDESIRGDRPRDRRGRLAVRLHRSHVGAEHRSAREALSGWTAARCASRHRHT